MKKTYFVSGIDTDIGKSYAVGYLAAKWRGEGKRVITQKFIQTGNDDVSEDILLHRKIMKTELLPEDKSKLTMPEIFTYPASPHLAAKIDNRAIRFDKIETATKTLLETYDIVLIEGAGGLMVPLTETLLTIDYVEKNRLPLIFVTSGKLGSINHTLLSFEAIERRGISLVLLVYNLFSMHPDDRIEKDTEEYIRKEVCKRFPQAQFVKLPRFNY